MNVPIRLPLESSPALRKEHDLQGLKYDDYVQRKRTMTHIVEVELKLLECIHVALAIRIVDLGPAGDSRPHKVPITVKRNAVFVLFHTLDPFRAWTDHAHVSSEHIPELGYLVDSRTA